MKSLILLASLSFALAASAEPRSARLSNSPNIQPYYCYPLGIKPDVDFKGVIATDIYASSLENALAQAATFFWNQRGLQVLRTSPSGSAVLWNDIRCSK